MTTLTTNQPHNQHTHKTDQRSYSSSHHQHHHTTPTTASAPRCTTTISISTSTPPLSPTSTPLLKLLNHFASFSHRLILRKHTFTDTYTHYLSNVLSYVSTITSHLKSKLEQDTVSTTDSALREGDGLASQTR